MKFGKNLRPCVPRSYVNSLVLTESSYFKKCKPVLKAPGCFLSHCGTMIPIIRLSPRIVAFLVDIRSVFWSVDIPMTVIIPYTTVNVPPMIGLGTIIKMAPNLPNIPQRRRMSPVTWKTRLLATYNRRDVNWFCCWYMYKTKTSNGMENKITFFSWNI